ncbi:MAG: hypothetical protein RIA72_12100 [Sphingopyxis sp.]|jgi:hypothetical protein|uniref:hypothetical protein n=1 Tax=Sphingopyxis sp. TaxID=1908224 RepID=UPI0032F08AC2
MADGLLLAKEAFGFGGAILLAVPWLRDYRRRKDARSIARVEGRGTMQRILARLKAEDQAWFNAPKRIDGLCATWGLILIAASFLIGILTNLR